MPVNTGSTPEAGVKRRNREHMEEIALSKFTPMNSGKALALIIPAEIVKRLELVKSQKVRVMLDENGSILLKPLRG
jgi:hypothetical protein